MNTKLDNSRQEAVDKNYEAFKKKLPNLLNTHAGKYALMRNKEVIEIYDTFHDAVVTGDLFYEDELYSVQKITDQPILISRFLRETGEPENLTTKIT